MNGYVVETEYGIVASGAQLIRLADNVSEGTAEIDFVVPTAGAYNLVVWYYDENDGASQMAIQLANRGDVWTLNESTDNNQASASNRRFRNIPAIELAAGVNRLQFRGTLNGGEVARLDAFELVPLPARNVPVQPVVPSPIVPKSTAGGKLLIEAEQMRMNGYVVETEYGIVASGAQLIRLADNVSEGTAEIDFVVPTAGAYNLVVWYYDENDGASQMAIQLANRGDVWTLNESTDNNQASASNRRFRNIPAIELAAGVNRLQFRGTLNGGETARLDAFELVPLPARNAPVQPVQPVQPSPIVPKSTAGGKLLIEAEQMRMNGYVVETEYGIVASGAQLIRLADNVSEGTAEIDFVVPTAGAYNLVVWYYDENDGASQMAIQLANRGDVWTLNESTDNNQASASNRRFRNIPAIELAAGVNRLQFRGTLNGGEVARLDAFELVPLPARNAPVQPVRQYSRCSQWCPLLSCLFLPTAGQ